MPIEAALINGPAIDFTSLLTITRDALGYSISDAADSSARKLADAEKFLSCLAALKDRSAEITSSLLSHVSFSILVIAGEHELVEIIDLTSGMSFVHSLVSPDADMAIISGTLGQWKTVVASGTGENASPTVRACYSKILRLFDRAGLTSVWQDYDRTIARDRSGLLLEHMRK